MKLLEGVDLSTYQRNVDYVALCKAIDFGYVKCADASMKNGVWVPFEDDMHAIHVNGIRGQNKPTGDYCFGHPSMDVFALADFFVSHAWFDQLKPVIDMEALSQGHTPPNAGPWCLAFMQRVLDHTGVRMLRYAGPYYDDDMLKQCPALADWDKVSPSLWEAAYPGRTTAPDYMPTRANVVAWQWTGKGTLPGIHGDADRDVAPSLDQLLASTSG